MGSRTIAHRCHDARQRRAGRQSREDVCGTNTACHVEGKRALAAVAEDDAESAKRR